MAQSDSDRKLYEYQRQLKAPKIVSDKFPAMSKLLSPYAAHMEDPNIYNKLGEKVEGDSPYDWQRNAEAALSEARAKDVEQVFDPLKLAEKLGYNAEYVPKINASAQFNDTKNTIEINPDDIQKNTNAYNLDTIYHEAAGHGGDFKKDPDAYIKNIWKQTKFNPATNTNELADEGTKFNETIEQNAALQKKGDLYNVARNISKGHFLKEGSSSINNPIEIIKNYASSQGLLGGNTRTLPPDLNPEYSELNYIKPTIKELEGYDPDTPEQSKAFSKLKAYLQNPGVALDEFGHRYSGTKKDILESAAQDNSDRLNQMVPGTTSQEKELQKLNMIEGLANASGVANTTRAFLSPANSLAASLENAPLTRAEDIGQRLGTNPNIVFKKIQEILNNNPASDIAAANVDKARLARIKDELKNISDKAKLKAEGVIPNAEYNEKINPGVELRAREITEKINNK